MKTCGRVQIRVHPAHEMKIPLAHEGDLRSASRTCQGVYRQKAPLFRGALAPRITPELEFLYLRIPVEIVNSRKGSKRLSMQRERLPEMLGVSESEIDRLCDCGLILPHPEAPTPKRKARLQGTRCKVSESDDPTAPRIVRGARSASWGQPGLGKQGVEGD